MSRLWIPAIHLPNGREVFRTLDYRPAEFKRVLKSYAERFLLQCEPGDVIVLAEKPDADYLRFLLERGMGTENVILCKGDKGNLAQDILADSEIVNEISSACRAVEQVSYYIHLEEEREISNLLGNGEATMHPDLARMFNRQFFMLRLIEDLGLPAIERVPVRSNRFLEPAAKLFEKWGSLFVRGNESCGGSQVYIIKNVEELESVDKNIRRNRTLNRYFVSRLIAFSESWNVQYEMDSSGATYTGASSQCLDEGLKHQGNRGGCEPSDELLGISGRVAQRLLELGARGTIGIDIAVDGDVAYPVEVNARQNSSTPVLSVYSKFSNRNNGGKLFFETLSVGVPRNFIFESFKELLGKENLFDPDSGKGALPYHLQSARLTGRIDVALFADCEGGLIDLKSRLIEAV